MHNVRVRNARGSEIGAPQSVVNNESKIGQKNANGTPRMSHSPFARCLTSATTSKTVQHAAMKSQTGVYSQYSPIPRMDGTETEAMPSAKANSSRGSKARKSVPIR